jgi:transposase
VQGRRLLVERVLVAGWTVPMAAEAQGCSAATGYKWIRRFAAEGPDRLRDRSSRPHRSPMRLSPAREAAVAARRQATLEGPHRIVVRYERERPGELVHVDIKMQGKIPAGGGWGSRS